MRSPLLLAAAIPLCTLAQTGTNSSCATAMELEVSPTNVQTSLIPVYWAWFDTAVPDPATPCSGNTACISSWYRFTATATSHWVRTEGQGTDDASMEVFSGSCGSLTSIGCFPANSATPALTGLSVGSSYTLRVRMASGNVCVGQGNACQVWIGVVSAPANDECAGATELPVTSGATEAWPATEVSSLGATQSQTACVGDPTASNDDVWYRFTATANTHFLVNTRLSTAVQDNVFQWFSGTCANLTSLGCDVNYKTGLTPGTQYYIRAYNESTGAETMRAVADVYAPAPHDECSGALPLEVTPVGGPPKPVRISTIHTTSSTVPCDTELHDAWLSFTAPGTTVIVATDVNQSAALYSGSCGGLVCVAEDWSAQGEFTGLTPGANYFLKLGGGNAARKNVTVWAFAPIPNDDCTTAIPIAVQNDPDVFTEGHQFNASERAWYTFTATATHHIVEGYRTAGENGIAGQAQVYSGVCGSLTPLSVAFGISYPFVISGFTVGQQYHLEMKAVWPSAFRVAVRDVVVNDACDGAIELPFRTVMDYSSAPRATNDVATDGTGGCLPTKDVWYRFTAAHTSAGFMAVNGDQGFLDTSIELFKGSCGSLTSLGCTNDAPRAIFNGLVPGTEYRIRWSRASIGFHTPMLFDQPVNDEVAGALTAPWGSTFAQAAEQYGTFGATESMPTHCPGWAPDDDTWFTFTASATSHSVQAQQRNNAFHEPSLFPYSAFQVQVYDTLTSDAAVLATNVVGCGSSPVALTGLTVGKQYLSASFKRRPVPPSAAASPPA